MDRRETLGLGLSALALMANRASADSMDADGRIATDSTEIVPLWPGFPPGGEKVTAKTAIKEASPTPDQFHNRRVISVAIPLLTVYRAAAPNGSALLLMPGGGYGIELIDREGIETARLFNRAGITCFILRYRLPLDGWVDGADAPLQDAQRAMRLIRANAATYGVNPAKVGVIGFSAGGHLAASLATRFTAEVYAPRDSADSQDAKPSIVALLFPVTTMGDGTDPGTRANLLGNTPSPEAILAYSCDKHVPPNAPPSFICFAADDPVASPMANGMAMYHALRAAGVASELHVFEQGGHGFGAWNAAGKSFAAWPQLFLQWGAGHGFIALTPPEAARFTL
ncbi:MAG TPA: alpha/beta hydrolase [Rhizomicrobium sp.]|jgi:acetyl esterase/lipase|nr:alpha/beta hydrolase [Rhizomicrobium sp.]